MSGVAGCEWHLCTCRVKRNRWHVSKVEASNCTTPCPPQQHLLVPWMPAWELR